MVNTFDLERHIRLFWLAVKRYSTGTSKAHQKTAAAALLSVIFWLEASTAAYSAVLHRRPYVVLLPIEDSTVSQDIDIYTLGKRLFYAQRQLVPLLKNSRLQKVSIEIVAGISMTPPELTAFLDDYLQKYLRHLPGAPSQYRFDQKPASTYWDWRSVLNHKQ